MIRTTFQGTDVVCSFVPSSDVSFEVDSWDDNYLVVCAGHVDGRFSDAADVISTAISDMKDEITSIAAKLVLNRTSRAVKIDFTVERDRENIGIRIHADGDRETVDDAVQCALMGELYGDIIEAANQKLSWWGDDDGVSMPAPEAPRKRRGNGRYFLRDLS